LAKYPPPARVARPPAAAYMIGTMLPDDLTAPTAEDIARIGRATLAALPEPFRQHIRDVPVIVLDLAEDQVLDEMGIDSPYDLLGLYHGASVERKLAGQMASDLDRIFLYRDALLLHWIENGERLGDLVRNVLIHEIGHHFGLSDADMEAIEAAAD
jgi:predicted Zn-dependent protease with MMP-like domain